jgi:signal peptidase I
VSFTVAVAGPRTHTFREGWGWLLLATVSRAYLVFLLSLAACALLPMLTGLSGAIVQSGSMEPHIGVGDVVLSRALPADSPPPMGRVVTFRAPAGSATSGFVLHRVVGANHNGSLVTAGDANADADSAALDRRNILSVASLLIPWIGLPAFWATTGALLPLGIWVLLTAGAVFIDVTEATSRHRHRNSGGSTRFGRGGINPDSPTDPAPRRGRALSSFFTAARAATAPTVVSVAVLVTVAALAMAPFGQATAAFSARTASFGNSWSVGGVAVRLAFTTNPSGSTGGIPFATQPVVAVQDVGGNTATLSAAPVTLSITTPAGAILTCTANPKSAVSGMVAFAGCSINKPGTYTLTATSGLLTAAVSTSLTITTGPAAKLAFTASPSNTALNTVFATQPRVAVQDAGGNTVSSSASVRLTLTTPAGATLTCTANPKNAVSGLATFSGCRIDRTGSYTLTATSSGLTTAVSASFTIFGPATKLAFTTNPSGSTGGVPFATQPVVAVQDAGGNTVATSTASVTLSITTPAGATLTCTANPKSAVSGLATFSGCSINKPGTYTLTATSGVLTAAISTSLTVTTGPAAKLAFTTNPSGSTGGVPFAAQPVVAVQDAGGNTVATSTAPVTLGITTPAGATLTCTANPKNAVSGVAVFSGCSINKTGTYTLTATSGGLATAVSTSLAITTGPAVTLAFTSTPTNAAPNTVFATQPVVAVQDAGGNTVATSTAPVMLSLTPPMGATLTCTANPKNAVFGVAAFAGCRINRTGTYTLTATSSGLAAAVSTSVTIG